MQIMIMIGLLHLNVNVDSLLKKQQRFHLFLWSSVIYDNYDVISDLVIWHFQIYWSCSRTTGDGVDERQFFFPKGKAFLFIFLLFEFFLKVWIYTVHPKQPKQRWQNLENKNWQECQTMSIRPWALLTDKAWSTTFHYDA